MSHEHKWIWYDGLLGYESRICSICKVDINDLEELEMKEFEVMRSDKYLVRFKAENMKKAEELLEEDDELLNRGVFDESEFGVIEEVKDEV